MDKSRPSRVPAFLAYLLLVVGWLFVLVAHRDDEFARFHTRQSIMLVLSAIVSLGAWAIFGWIISWIPFVGPVVATASFALVISVGLYLFVLWIVGMISVLQAKERPLSIPIIGRWIRRLPI